jgi:hypothetical protein
MNKLADPIESSRVPECDYKWQSHGQQAQHGNLTSDDDVAIIFQ